MKDRIDRYQAWLLREPVERPMIGLLWEADIRPLPKFIESVGQGEPITHGQIQPEMFLPFIETWYNRDAQLTSDIIQSFSPAFGILWAEAILGCPIVAGKDSIWAMPFLNSYDDRPPIIFNPENPWLRKLVEFTQALVNLSDGRYPIALPPIHSPLDMLGAMRGDEKMLLDLAEKQSAVKEMLNELSNFYLSLVDAILDIIPPFYGGYTTRMKMWAPGKAITPQNEYASMISTKMYEEFALPLDKIITTNFPYHSFHLHGSAQHQIDLLLTLENLTAIQITLEHDVGGPSLEIMLPKVRRILKEKPLLLVVPDVETAETCIRELPWAGLCVLVLVSSIFLGEKYDVWLEAQCAVG